MIIRKSAVPLITCVSAGLIFAGCSAKDPVTKTPDYHVGTPTNRSSVNSWEIGTEPYYTQPGVNGGKPVVIKTIPSQRGFEPNDPLALAILNAAQNQQINTKYLAPRAKNGVVILDGTTDSASDKAKIEDIARHTPGVKTLQSHLRVAATQ